MSNTSGYVCPLGSRYGSEQMKRIFSQDKKFSTWRKLWIALAESEKELGLDISDEQIIEMKSHIYDINYDDAKRIESEVRHDVMSHVKAYGLQCPKAKGIIHLGATSCYVGDNTDIILMKEAMLLIRSKLISAVSVLSDFSVKYKDLACLAYTHFQAAQPTTVGKRATLWINEFMLDLDRLNAEIDNLKMLGCKGTTGTAASFAELFDGDFEKAEKLDSLIAEKMGFTETYPVSGQTYSRKVDFNILSVLSGIAQSAHKFSNDIRLLSHLKEVDEPFESGQIGSSAMAYKRNPMRSERIASLSRYVIALEQNPAMSASEQWFERTLDDSANKRMSVPEAFLATDAVLELVINVASGMTVYENRVAKHLNEEMPFMATENIMMYLVKEKGGDRQELHEAIRELSVQTAKDIKLHGKENNLIEKILNDKRFLGITEEEIKSLINPEAFIGFASQQTEKYINEYVKPVLDRYREEIDTEVDINI